MHWNRSWVSGVALALLVSGCPSKVMTNVAPEPTRARQALGEDECAQDGAFLEPLVVDMKDHDRAQIELALGQGIAVFRAGCDGLALLPRCSVDEGDYNYVGFSKKERVMQLRTLDELEANLPTLGALWATELSADFERGASLDIALVTVGQRATAVPAISRDMLRGECEGATHFVKHAYLGAFAMEAGSRARVRTAVEIFDIGGASSSSSDRFEKIVDGELQACGAATTLDTTPPEGCAAVLRVGLSPLVERLDLGADLDATCPSGMVRFGALCTADTTMARCQSGDLAACQTLCDGGDIDGCYQAAARDYNNPENALLALRRLCDEHDHYDACHSTAQRLRDIDMPSALPYWKKACDLGTGGHECRIWAGDYLTFKGDKATLDDRREALVRMERTCAQGESYACAMVGNHYIEPDPKRRVVEPDEQKALDFFMNACMASHSSCFSAAALIEGQSWCEQTDSDPKLCKAPLPSKNPVDKDPARALSLYRRACADMSLSCHNLFRFGAFDEVRVKPGDGAPEQYCTEPPVSDIARVGAVYSCTLASHVARQDQRPDDARRHLQKACDESAWLASIEPATCKDLHIRNNVWACNDVHVAQEASAWACSKL